MKKMISLLSVALFATFFAAGCGPYTKCTDAGSKEECNKKENFAAEAGKCKWFEKTGDTPAKCDKDPDAKDDNKGNKDKFVADDASTQACNAQNADPAACAKVPLTQKNAKCEYDAAAKVCKVVEVKK